MPQGLSDRWETVALQLQTVLHEASRMRTAAEEETGSAVADFFEEAGSERGGMTQQVLKASIIHAAKEVSQFRKIHNTWRKNTDYRIDRLLDCAAEAEHAQQQLLAAEAQLSDIRGDSKAKSKGVLMSMAEGQLTALMHSVFSTWLGWVEKVHAEAAIRKKFTDQIELCESRLIQYKEAQMANVKNVLMRGAMEEQDVLLHMVWKFWIDEVNERKGDGDTAAALKIVQDKLAAAEQSQKENAGKFMTRMASGNDESLKNLCLEAWIKFHGEYAQDKEFEDKVKAQEQALRDHMDAKKEEAKAVMERMLGATDHGLLCMMVQHWQTFVKEEKRQRELDAHLGKVEEKTKQLNHRQKVGATNIQNRVNEQIDLNSLQRMMNFWIVETKANRIENHYTNKYESKRRQLQGVQNLFKSFAMQLEQNLGQDDDSSSRSVRRGKKSSTASMSKGADYGVSLPDINQKQAA
jgi:hypothetical protein